MTIALVIIWLMTSFLTAGLAYAVYNKKEYRLLNGVSSYSKEEMEEAEKKGYFTVVGRYLWGHAIIFIFLFPIGLFGVPYGMEIFVSVLIVYTLGGAMYAITKDIKRTKKRNMIILGITTAVVVGIFGYLGFEGFQETDIQLHGNKITMDGMYDDEVKYADMESVELRNTLPKNLIKSNGFSTSTRLLGSFRSKEEGPSRYYVFTDDPPYLFIETKDKMYVINSKDPKVTKKWYEELRQHTE
ncbi:MAG: hypothetical protein ACI4XL_02195 [Bacillus sp. (in: firmicutes)]